MQIPKTFFPALRESLQRWGHQVKRLCYVWMLLPRILAIGGGLTGTIAKVFRVIRRGGFAGIQQRIQFAAANDKTIGDKWKYDEWIYQYDTVTYSSRKTMLRHVGAFVVQPVISVAMPVYNTDIERLRDAIESVRSQIYPHWELCIAPDTLTIPQVRQMLEDFARLDPRIKVQFAEKPTPASVAANHALSLASGEFFAILDHHDLLAEHALYWVADAVNRHPDAALIYSDEDVVDEKGRRADPYFKCDWNYDLFLAQDLVSRLGVYRTAMAREIGGCRQDYEGSQYHDLALRYSERIRHDQIVHIPRVLYHRRDRSAGGADTRVVAPEVSDAGCRAISDHLVRKNVVAASVTAEPRGSRIRCYRVQYALPSPAPRVSLIIPTYNKPALIKQCVNSILDKTDYPNYEVLIVDNRSDDPEALAYFESLRRANRIRVLRDERPFNFSALNNGAIAGAGGEIVGLINNDTEVITPGWLTEMVSIAMQPGVGAVGARLWYPDDTLQHGGVILGIGGGAGHSHKGLPKAETGHNGRAVLMQTISAVTAACLIVRKEIYWQAGGMDEINLQVAFNDVDFCLKVRELGYRNVWTPYAELYHHESATRGIEDNPAKQERFAREVKFLQQRWRNEILYDPAYSPNLTVDREDFSIAWPPRVKPLL